MKNSKGFSVIEGLLVIVVLAIVGALGYLGYINFIAPTPSSTTDISEGPVKVKSSQDLDKVSKELETLPVNDSELEELDSAVNSF